MDHQALQERGKDKPEYNILNTKIFRQKWWLTLGAHEADVLVTKITDQMTLSSQCQKSCCQKVYTS